MSHQVARGEAPEIDGESVCRKRSIGRRARVDLQSGLSPLTGLSRHTRWCMKDLLRVGRFGPPFSSPQESHCRDAVEGSSHVEDEVPRGELADLQSGPRSTWRCDMVVVLGSDRCLDAPPERPPRRAAAVLGSRHRDRPDPAAPLSSPAAPGRRVLARAVRDNAPRPLRSRLDEALTGDDPGTTGRRRGSCRR